MSANFDPYHKWLGIPPHQQPPHDYRLLGVDVFEEDPDVIANAADKQMGHVRTFQNGPHGKLSQQLLNELAQARGRLLNPQTKAAYDTALRAMVEEAKARQAQQAAQIAGQQAAATAYGDELTEVAVLQPAEERSAEEIALDNLVAPQNAVARRRSKSVFPLLLFGGVAVVAIMLAAGGAIYYVMNQDLQVAQVDPGNIAAGEDPDNDQGGDITADPNANNTDTSNSQNTGDGDPTTEAGNETGMETGTDNGNPDPGMTDVPADPQNTDPDPQIDLELEIGDGDDPADAETDVKVAVNALPAVPKPTGGKIQIDPKLYGFDIPPGRVRMGNDRTVLVRDVDGVEVVAKIYVEVGENIIAMMPDGRLVSRLRGETQGTTQKFEPATKDQLAANLIIQFPGFRIKETRRYLYVYNTSEEFVTATSRILETMYPGVVAHARSQRIDIHEPEVPMIVILFRNRQEYQAYTGSTATAFYHTKNNCVAIYEDEDLEEGISTIAHEGVHQIMANIGVEKRLSRWPIWLSEGIAEYFSPINVDERMRWGGAGGVNKWRMLELDIYLRERSRVTGRTITNRVTATRLSSTDYAISWAMTHYLAKNKRSDFYAYIKEISELQPLEMLPPDESLALFGKHFGTEFEEMEVDVHRHLKNLAGTN